MSVTESEFYDLIGWTAADDFFVLYGQDGVDAINELLIEAITRYGAEQVTIVMHDGYEYHFGAAE